MKESNYMLLSCTGGSDRALLSWSQCGVQYFIIGITSLSSFTMPFKQLLILAQVAVRVRVMCAPVLGDRGLRCKHVVYAASWAQAKQRAAFADSMLGAHAFQPEW